MNTVTPSEVLARGNGAAAGAGPPGRSGRAADVTRDRAGQSRPVHQPRAVLARLQPPRGGGGGEPAPSAAGAAALRLDQRVQPRRVLLGPRRRPDRPGQGRRHRASRPTGGRPAQQLAEIKLRAESLLAEQQRVWRELRGLLREAGIEVCEPDELLGRRRELARRLVHGAGVPGADAARDRPGASVPVHPQHGPGDGAAAAARGGWRRACAALLPLPSQVDRFIRLPGGEPASRSAS